MADPITAKRADHIITVSENSKRDIMKFLGVRNNKISVVHNGVDQEKFKKMDHIKAAKILKEREWPTDYILYVGTIDHPGKNVMGVIRAFEEIKKTNVYSGSLILAGMSGANHEVIDEHVERSMFKNAIIRTGFVTDEELVALYSECKVLCFVSLYEGFGIPPLEALSCGAKVIVSNTSSLPEVVGTVGITVDPQDNLKLQNAIKSVLINSEIDETYNQMVKQHLAAYDWKNLSKKFERDLCQ